MKFLEFYLLQPKKKKKKWNPKEHFTRWYTTSIYALLFLLCFLFLFRGYMHNCTISRYGLFFFSKLCHRFQIFIKDIFQIFAFSLLHRHTVQHSYGAAFSYILFSQNETLSCKTVLLIISFIVHAWVWQKKVTSFK